MTEMPQDIEFGLAMSLYKDYKPALKTAKDFADNLGETVTCVPLLLEVDLRQSDSLCDGASLQEVLTRFALQGWKGVRAWTRETTDIARKKWPAELVNPFDPEFSYGGILVKTQALATLAGCSFVVRTDPTTRPPKDLVAAILRHIKRIEMNEADVVAGKYDGRFAVRTDFLPQKPQELHEELRAELFRLVERFTKVVPEDQIIGGALYTCRTECSPPPPLGAEKRVAIVLSDDGFMKTVLGNRAKTDENTLVSRSESGFSMSSHDYRVRLSLMAGLDQLWSGETSATAAAMVVNFYQALGALVADTKDVDVAAAKKATDATIGLIARGVDRYYTLLDCWKDCLGVVASRSDLVRATEVAQPASNSPTQ